MKFLSKTIKWINKFNDLFGRAVSWLVMAMVLVAVSVVVMRYVFNTGFIWMQELYVWMHGIIFMMGAAYTLLHDKHVRVDVFYARASKRYKAWVNLLGSIFLLLPVISMIFYTSFPYVLDSWQRHESSYQAGGLSGVFLIKSVLLGFCLLMLLQMISVVARSILVLLNRSDLVDD